MQALIIVDIQNDFLPSGALPIPMGNEIISIVNKIQPYFELVVATQDWHPNNHGSFASNHKGHRVFDVIELKGLQQVLWPDHCVQGSQGADFARSLDMNNVEAIFRKGTDPAIDSYSGFFDNGHFKATGMGGYLKDRGVEKVYVVGLAGEYCVNYTILDSLSLGFDTTLIKDATRPLSEDEFIKAMSNMVEKSAKVITSENLK